jgi:hypothetical protein
MAALLLCTENPAQRAKSPTAYLGFDRNEYPGDVNLAALRQTFAFTGYWLNAPPGGSQSTWSGKRRVLQEAGFGFAILFNGRVYRELKGLDAAATGGRDGLLAVAAAKREAFPERSVIFLDQEEGGRLLPEQKTYLYSWVDAVNAARYRPGVYCSGIDFVESDGAHIVTANDIRNNAHGRALTYWVSNDSCPPSPGCALRTAATPSDSGIAFAELWQFAQSPRRPDQTSKCARTYASDGNCYPPGLQDSGLHVDVSTATSPDPSRAQR